MGLKETLESRKLFLWMIGFWPKEYQRKFNYSRIKLYFIFSNIIILGLLVFAGIFIGNTPENISHSIFEFVGYIGGVVKLLPYVITRKRAQKLILKTIELDESTEGENDRELEIMKSWRNLRDKIVKYHGRFIMFDIVQYFFVPMFSKVKAFPIQTIIRASLFDSPWYQFFYMFHGFELFVLMGSVIAVDSCNVIIISKLCEELQRIECLLLEKRQYTKSYMKNKRSEVLQRVIRKHCTVLDFGENVCDFLARTLFIQYICGSGIVCFSAFTILSSESGSAMANRTFVVTLMCLIQLFAMGLAGESILTRSLGLADALLQSDICCSNFGELKPSELRLLVLMQLRMQKPLKFSIGIHSIINLDYFARTMKGVYSFFMLLRTSYA